MNIYYDVIIIGTGPAGLSAGIYAGRYLLKTLIIGEFNGGMISRAYKVCNFPSYESISGFELSEKMINHAIANGCEIISNKVLQIVKKTNFEFIVKTQSDQYLTKKIIIANGRNKRKLGIIGEDEFFGKGVSYCATCDGAFYKEKNVAVIGGSNSALSASILLSDYAKNVFLIHRKSNFISADQSWVKLVESNQKISVLFNSEVSKILGKNFVEKIILKDEKEFFVDGVFVEIGFDPDDTFVKQLDIITEKGYIVVDKKQKTNVFGVFACGDITNNPLKQAITAASEGAIAASSVYEELAFVKDN